MPGSNTSILAEKPPEVVSWRDRASASSSQRNTHLDEAEGMNRGTARMRHLGTAKIPARPRCSPPAPALRSRLQKGWGPQSEVPLALSPMHKAIISIPFYGISSIQSQHLIFFPQVSIIPLHPAPSSRAGHHPACPKTFTYCRLPFFPCFLPLD